MLYIPDIVDQYPDFKTEEYTLDEVRAFCEKYNLTLSIVYEETNDYDEGTIIKQSRTGKITPGATLKITVAKKLQEEQTNQEMEKEEQTVEQTQ